MRDHPIVQARIFEDAAVGVFLAELERDLARARFEVGAESQPFVRGQAELQLVRQDEIGLCVGAAERARRECLARN